MHRFFVPPETLAGDEVNLPPDVSHHLGTVLRRPVGEEIVLLDGIGTLCRCVVTTVGRGGGTARIVSRWREEETAFPITLLQAVPKGEKMELVLQKGTELGVTAFVPVLAARSVPLPVGDREERRLLRWERIIQEAARQCRRPRLPSLVSPLPLTTALSDCREDLRLFLWEEESRPLADVLPAGRPAGAAVLVGPEGGFSAGEAAEIRAAGFRAVSLGRRILRTETAGFAVASILQFLYGDFGTLSASLSATLRPEDLR